MQRVICLSVACVSALCVGGLSLRLYEVRLKRRCFKEGVAAAVLIARLVHAAAKLLCGETFDGGDDSLSSPIITGVRKDRDAASCTDGGLLDAVQMCTGRL